MDPNHTIARNLGYRIDRVVGFFSSRPNRDHPIPSPAGDCVTTPFMVSGEGTHSLAGERLGGPNSDEGTDTYGTLGL